MSVQEHRRPGAPVRCAIVTVSDSRTVESDESGRVARAALEKAGHTIVSHTIVPNDAEAIRAEVSRARERGAQLVLTSGGTGISPRDTTLEALGPLLTRRLPGFGELFRMLSFDEIGAAAMLSRADLGVCDGGLIVACVPGSRNAVKLAVEQILVPELHHLVSEPVKTK
jgi:molybdenum cofactor biosynthesis protein B